MASVIEELVEARAALLDLHGQVHAGKPDGVLCEDWSCARYHDAMRAVVTAGELIGLGREELDHAASERREN